MPRVLKYSYVDVSLKCSFYFSTQGWCLQIKWVIKSVVRKKITISSIPQVLRFLINDQSYQYFMLNLNNDFEQEFYHEIGWG